MSAHLFDPAVANAADWPRGRALERDYISAIARVGVPLMVSNVQTQWRALRVGGRVLPVTINDGEYGDSYVCLPHSAYILYGRQELDLVDMGGWTPLLKTLLKGADRVLRRADINRIVHVDNWLLSTNLHGDWTGEGLADMARMMTGEYPDHILAIRSVDEWSSPSLMAATRAAGWTLLPSRQIWVTDDMDVWARKNSTRNDRRLVRRSALDMGGIETLRPGDAERIAELYHQLYVGRYSALNPVFTADYVRATHASGLLHYRGARDADGRLMAVSGSLIRGDILTPPVVGYDTTRPQSEGLYRIACYQFSELARERGLRLNGSAGASDFKKCRGARPVTEYTALYTAHLGRRRRASLDRFAALLDRFLVPEMRRREL